MAATPHSRATVSEKSRKRNRALVVAGLIVVALLSCLTLIGKRSSYEYVHLVCWIPGTSRVALADGKRLCVVDDEGDMVWSTQDARLTPLSIQSHAPDRRIAVLYREGWYAVFDGDTGQELSRFAVGSVPLLAGAISQDAAMAVTVSVDSPSVALWDLMNQAQTGTLSIRNSSPVCSGMSG